MIPGLIRPRHGYKLLATLEFSCFTGYTPRRVAGRLCEYLGATAARLFVEELKAVGLHYMVAREMLNEIRWVDSK